MKTEEDPTQPTVPVDVTGTGMGEPPADRAPELPATERPRLQSPRKLVQELRRTAGPVGLLPLFILLGLSAAERFDFTAYGVLGPEIRHAFGLNNSEYLGIAALAQIVPLALSVPIGYMADTRNRVRLSRVAGVVWAVTAIGSGLAPTVALFTLFRMAGGIGFTVNQPVHSSLLSDYYPPEALAPVFSFYLLAFNAAGLIAGPVAGGISALAGWRV